jgi:hypothetical protein
MGMRTEGCVRRVNGLSAKRKDVKARKAAEIRIRFIGYTFLYSFS